LIDALLKSVGVSGKA